LSVKIFLRTVFLNDTAARIISQFIQNARKNRHVLEKIETPRRTRSRASPDRFFNTKARRLQDTKNGERRALCC
jgi:hypothetical protein